MLYFYLVIDFEVNYYISQISLLTSLY